MQNEGRKLRLFCPTRFEVPSKFKSRTEIFGMGVRRAEVLAKNLNQSPIDSPIIIFGSAGALAPHLKPGDTFIIDEIFYDGKSHQLEIPHLDFARARLFTSKTLLKTRNEKKHASDVSRAALVDMEMGALWCGASETVRKNMILLRTVIDTSEQEFPNIKSLKFLADLFGIVKNWRVYLRHMNTALQLTTSKYSCDSAHPLHKEPD